MAALVAGVQYGLSSHSNFHENKTLIFVKLTDSAHRAIEDYLRNRNKINENPTIQFLGNEGQLSFPSTKSNHGNFTFSLSGNQDIEGPQGGFECVQQIGPKNLESLGALPCKMRIQANDDVYETTRHRMHVAEENNKNKCTRVIKANEPTGRKVKVKGTMRTIPPPSQSSLSTASKHRESSSFPNFSSQSSKLPSSYNNKPPSSHSIPSRSQSDTQKKLPEIMRRPLKERLIHLLALRPFKRPELYDRINREGIREREKNIIANILKQIAFMRDNTYHLQRCLWNDVQEEWPFYTEQEKAMLKRRKPQNLTPPGSSDGGSSGSGQSPNSTHPGSPPAITAPPPGLMSSKRPGYFQGNDGLPTKRQRISHYRKPESGFSSNSGECAKASVASSVPNNCDRKPSRQRHQNQDQQQQSTTFGIKTEVTSPSHCKELGNNTSAAQQSAFRDSFYNSGNNHSIVDNVVQHQEQPQQQQQPLVRSKKIIKEEEGLSIRPQDSIAYNAEEGHGVEQYFTEKKYADEKEYKDRNREKYNSSDLGYSPHSSSSAKATDYSGSSGDGDSILPFSTSINKDLLEKYRRSGVRDYLTQYTTISSDEQRSLYKSEFHTLFCTKYSKLRSEFLKISDRFVELQEELRDMLQSGNIEGSEAIKAQVLEEYARSKDATMRFFYLHDKLNHIQKLVADYDEQSCNNNSQMISSPNYENDTHMIQDHDVKEPHYALEQIEESPLKHPSKLSHIS